tara:strand:+ start:550 stop:1191 length:642 start_codon:yes stop_codon:yes gene_type:complete
MKNLVIGFGFVLIFLSCKKETLYPLPCGDGCGSEFNVYYKDSLLVPSSDGYIRVEWGGLGYFQIRGILSPLNPQYVINGVPLVETRYDSDYWVLIDTLRFTTPMYSYLGWFRDGNFNNPISVGSYTGTMVDISKLHSPLNIVGYSIPRNFCFDCPAASTYIGSYSKYTYAPTQNIFLDDEMVGDTISLFTETTFNTDVGEREIINREFKIIIE